MTFFSQAQNFEDVILWRALRTVEAGFYIDVGAGSPELHSVTKAFYELGWSGINIEPDPTAFEKLQRQRLRDMNVNACAGATQGTTKFFLVPSSGLSTALPVAADAYRDDGYSIEAIEVPQITLHDVCQQHVKGEIHFLKIDVEGSERDVLLGMDFKKWRPWIVVCEATSPNSRIETYTQWEDLLRTAEYEFVYFDGLNRFYIAREHSELNESFRLPPNVFDGFVLNSSRDAWLRAEESEQRAAESRKEVHQARADLGAAQTDLEATLNDLRTAQTDLEATRNDLEAAQTDLKATRNDLRKARIDLREASKQLRSAAKTAAVKDAAIEQARSRVDELQTQLREQGALLEETRRLLGARELEISAAAALAATRNETIDELERTLGARNSELSVIKREALRTLAKKEQQIGALKAMLAERELAVPAIVAAYNQAKELLEAGQNENHSLKYERDKLLALAGHRERQLETVFSSTSWKLTSPLRRLGSQFGSAQRPTHSYDVPPAHQPAVQKLASPAVPAPVVDALPRRTIFVECTHTFHSDLNTGIQRVVRNVLRNAFEVSGKFDFAVAPVISEDGRYKIVHPGQILRNKQTEHQTRSTTDRSLIDDLYLPPDPRVEHLDQIASHAGNVLLLLDSSWTIPIWDGADRFKAAGGKVVGVVYDLIPITHSHTSVYELTVLFKRWFMRHMATTHGLVAISASVKNQIKDFAWQQGRLQWYSPIAPIKHFHLGGELDFAAAATAVGSPRLVDIFDSTLPTFLMVGSIEPRKMHHFVLAAFNRLWDAGDRVRLLIIGRQAWKTETLLEAIAAHPRLGTDLFLLRNATDDELEFAYREAAALIIASEIEGFGLPIVEAFGRGLPVLCSDIPVFREIASGKAQSFFKLDDPDYLVAAVRDFCARRKEGKVKRQVFEWLTWRDSTEQLFFALDDIVNSSNARAR